MYSFANKLVEPAKILIIVGMAYTLATTGWYIVSGPSVTPAAAKTNAASASPTGPTLDAVIGFELFGKADSDGGAVSPVVFDAPETRLKLTLEGVFQAEVAEDSAAIVAEAGRPGELYVIGGNLPGNAVLAEVHPDRIVLRRGATYETLRFSEEAPLLGIADQSTMQDLPDAPPQEYYEEPADESPPAEQPQEGDATRADTPPASDVLGQYRKQLEQDPRAALDNLGVAPVTEGAAQGYRLGNLAQSPYLAQTGLQAGDVVLSVNGRPVGDVQQDKQQLDNILAQGSARIEVQRGARRFFVTASLK